MRWGHLAAAVVEDFVATLQLLRVNTLDEAAPSVVITDHDMHRALAGVAQPGARIEAVGGGVRP